MYIGLQGRKENGPYFVFNYKERPQEMVVKKRMKKSKKYP